MKIYYYKKTILAIMFVFTIITMDRIFPPAMARFENLSWMMLDRSGDLLSVQQSHDEKWRILTTPEDVPDPFLKILLTFEDKRFYNHFGVDPLALLRAFGQYIKTQRIVSGGSTITMQVVKLLQPHKRTLGYKILEILRALQLEVRYSKSDILKMYLTLAPMGGNLEGVYAASLAYFQKSPKNLMLSEMALLVAIPQSPTRLRPNIHSHHAKAARDKVLNRLVAKKILTVIQCVEAKDDAVPIHRHRFPDGAPHLLNRLKKQNNFVIKTTIDGNLQRKLSEMLRAQSHQMPDQQTAAMLVVDNATGNVLAYIGSIDYHDKNRLGYVDIIPAIRSPGSTLKPFIYAFAFDEEIAMPESLMTDMKTDFAGYAPTNFRDVFHGDVTITEALQYSLNIPAVMMLEKIGPGRFYQHLISFPISIKIRGAIASLPIALGGLGISLYDLTSLYVALANGGTFKTLSVEEDLAGGLERDMNLPRLCSEKSAEQVQRILENASLPPDFVDWHAVKRYPVAFKTGTSYGGRDALCVGVTKDYTVSVWLGRADGSATSNQVGRQNAAPIMLSVFYNYLTPKSPVIEMPLSHSDLRYDALPANLKKIERVHISGKDFKIAYPLKDAHILLSDHALQLHAHGGRGVISWAVNGKPIDDAKWQPCKPGFYTLSAIDEDGNADNISVRIVE